MIYYRTKQIVNYANRGMILEDDINLTNKYYLENDIALIYKKPTPIKITKVDYRQSKINEAYFEAPSTLDYNGLYKGKYIDFEAKETTSSTSFPLKNIHPHQIEHLKKVDKHGGIAFLIIRFTKLNLTYFLSYEDFEKCISNGKKSIALDQLKKYGYLIKDKYNPRVDYIEIIDNYFLKGDNI